METKLPTRVNQFSDTEGRNWVVKVTVNRIKELRRDIGLNLAEALDPQKTVINELQNNVEVLANTVWVCCKDTKQEIDVDADMFCEALSGEVLDAATEALIGAIIDFFPKGKTELLRQSLAINSRMKERAKSQMAEHLTEITDEVIDQALVLLVKQSGKESIAALESSV